MVCLIVFQLHEDDVGEGYRVKGQNIPMSSVGGGDLSFFCVFFLQLNTVLSGAGVGLFPYFLPLVMSRVFMNMILFGSV